MIRMLAACFAAVAQAHLCATPKVLFTEGHLDINWSLQGGDWSVAYLDDDTWPPTEVEISEGILVAKRGWFDDGEGSRWLRPAGPEWDFTGAGEGDEIWLLPNSAAGDPILEPGFATYGVPTGSPDEVRLDLLGVDFFGEGEGHMSLLTNVELVHMDSADGIDESDFYLMGRGDHQHAFWIFTSPGVYHVTLAASMPLGPSEEDGRSASEPQTLTFAVGLEGVSLWALARGVPPEMIGPDDAPAGDAVPNLIKYALGLPPLVPVNGPVAATSMVSEGDEAYLALSVPRNPDAGDVVVRVETSSDLVSWNSGEGHTVALDDGPDRLSVRDAVPVGSAGSRFIRLRVE